MVRKTKTEVEPVEQAQEQQPTANPIRRFIVLWGMGAYSIIGYDDGEVGFANNEQLRNTHPSAWRSEGFRRGQGDPNSALFRGVIQQDEPPPARFDEQGQDLYAALQQYEVIPIRTVILHSDRAYWLRLGYGPRSKTWVVTAKPQPVQSYPTWPSGVTFAPTAAQENTVVEAEATEVEVCV